MNFFSLPLRSWDRQGVSTSLVWLPPSTLKTATLSAHQQSTLGVSGSYVCGTTPSFISALSGQGSPPGCDVKMSPCDSAAVSSHSTVRGGNAGFVPERPLQAALSPPGIKLCHVSSLCRAPGWDCLPLIKKIPANHFGVFNCLTSRQILLHLHYPTVSPGGLTVSRSKESVLLPMAPLNPASRVSVGQNRQRLLPARGTRNGTRVRREGRGGEVEPRARRRKREGGEPGERRAPGPGPQAAPSAYRFRNWSARHDVARAQTGIQAPKRIPARCFG